jgi:photosystem II stability/assembly factor-like uncharacterized protein
MGYAVGSDGLVLKTTDGGMSWKQQKTRTTSDFHSVQFPLDSKTGFIIGNGTIMKTTDGGE